MIALIDYENVGSNGLAGIEKLGKEDCAEIFFSDKNHTMTIDMVSAVRSSQCDIQFIRTEKTAPQYMDIQIICRACEVLTKEDTVGIVSKDNGYISAKDFHEKRNKTILLGKDISSILTSPGKANENASDSPFLAEVKEFCSSGTKRAVVPPAEKKPIKKVQKTKKLSEADKKTLKEMVKDLPKHNGMTASCVLECFDKCKTLGEMQFELNAKLGRKDGTRAYNIVQDMFLDFKGLKLQTSDLISQN